jgi:hypothetical protein
MLFWRQDVVSMEAKRLRSNHRIAKVSADRDHSLAVSDRFVQVLRTMQSRPASQVISAQPANPKQIVVVARLMAKDSVGNPNQIT